MVNISLEQITKETKKQGIQIYPGLEFLKAVLSDASSYACCRAKVMVLHFIGACEAAFGQEDVFKQIKENYLSHCFASRSYDAGVALVNQLRTNGERIEPVLKLVMKNIELKVNNPKYLSSFRQEELEILRSYAVKLNEPKQ